MAFDFEKNIHDDIDNVELTRKELEPILEEKINTAIEALNIEYKLKINSKNYYNGSDSYSKDEPFEYKEHFAHNYKAIHFYTRNIKNSGIGAWKTLAFWVETEQYHNLFKEIYFDGAAYESYDFFMETLGTDVGDYDSYRVLPYDEFELNFKYIKAYMNSVKKFRKIKYTSDIAYTCGAYFRANRIINLHNNINDIQNFIDFCGTYEQNIEYPIKFNISFVMSIINIICECYNYDMSIMQNISDRYKQIINDSEDLFLNPKDVSNVIKEYNLFKS